MPFLFSFLFFFFRFLPPEGEERLGTAEKRVPYSSVRGRRGRSPRGVIRFRRGLRADHPTRPRRGQGQALKIKIQEPGEGVLMSPEFLRKGRRLLAGGPGCRRGGLRGRRRQSPPDGRQRRGLFRGLRCGGRRT